MKNMKQGRTIKEILEKEGQEGRVYYLNLEDGESLMYDFTKTHLGAEEFKETRKKMRECRVEQKMEEMWTGEPINYTEKRPVLHYLLRDPDAVNKREEGAKRECSPTRKKAINEINEELGKIKAFCGEFKSMVGITGKQLDTIVNIGIGGSDLGPRMATKALHHYSENKKVAFISNVDGNAALEVFSGIDPEKTLFVVVSKTFTTAETMANFKLALNLFMNRTGLKDSKRICNQHFVAVSSNLDEVKKYGIERVFAMWDYVGGRYSLWSAVGLSIALYIGFENYLKLLKGASEADKEFKRNKTESIPAAMACVEYFYSMNGYNNKCIATYDIYLELLYKYLQQAEMESNGKIGSKQMIIWGGTGTVVQHSFFQQLHQGDQDVYVEFLLPAMSIHGSKSENNKKCCENNEEVKSLLNEHQNMLIANCLAQSRAFMVGKHSDDKNKYFPGDRPSTTILYSRLTPSVLGAILAIYEHKIFVLGLLYKINSFDQFGVQLGKDIAKELEGPIKSGEEDSSAYDPSTLNLIEEIRKISTRRNK